MAILNGSPFKILTINAFISLHIYGGIDSYTRFLGLELRSPRLARVWPKGIDYIEVCSLINNKVETILPYDFISIN